MYIYDIYIYIIIIYIQRNSIRTDRLRLLNARDVCVCVCRYTHTFCRYRTALAYLAPPPFQNSLPKTSLGILYI